MVRFRADALVLYHAWGFAIKSAILEALYSVVRVVTDGQTDTTKRIISPASRSIIRAVQTSTLPILFFFILLHNTCPLPEPSTQSLHLYVDRSTRLQT